MNKQWCTIDITHEYQCHAEVKSWVPFHLHLAVGHKRLGILVQRIETATHCGDRKTAAMWTRSRDRMIRALAGQAAQTVRPLMKKRRRLLDGVLTVLFTASTLLYLPAYKGYGIVADIILVACLWIVAREFVIREQYVTEIIAMSFRDQGSFPLKPRRKETANAKA